MKKLLALVLALIMIFALCACGKSAEESAAPAETAAVEETAAPVEEEPQSPALEGKTVFLYTNDVHGRVTCGDAQVGYAGYSAAKEHLQEQGAFVLLMDAGDAAQGTPVVNLDRGENAIEFMNRAGYDVACPGNHEFDWGYDNALRIADMAEFDYICANVIRKSDGLSIFKEHTLIDGPDGIKIGVFALDTPETATKSAPDNTAGLEVLADEELYQCARDQVAELRSEGAGFIICLGHLGEYDESTGNRSIDVLDNVEGIDLFIDGHSHTRIEGYVMNGETPRVSTGCYGKALGYAVYSTGADDDGNAVLELEKAGLYDAGGDIVSIIASGSPVAVDPVVDAYVDSVNEKISEKLSAVFARTEVELNGERAPGNRTEETNLGDFCCDAVLWQAEKSSGIKIDAAITNGGSIRQTIPAGDISMLDMKTVFPFDNTVAYLTLPGRDILEAMEAATFSSPDPSGGFPQVAGMEYELDCSQAWEPGEEYPDSTYCAPLKPGTRIKILSIGGEPFDPDKMYTIATNDFLAAGGDQYYAFRYNFKTAGFDTGVALEDALVNYTQSVLGGVIGEEYAVPQGRITVRGS